jgi:arylsulfatase A-like enzyme
MRTRKWKLYLVLSLVILLIGGSLAVRYFKKHPMHVWLITDPIGSYRSVSWEDGPATAEKPADKRPPNIVVILADDLGYNDLSHGGGGVGNGTLKTPHIDSLAENGVSFTNAYSGCATCAPSRASLLTGRIATRFGFEFTPAPKEFWKLIAGFRKDGDRPLGYPKAKYFKEREKDVSSFEMMGIPQDEVILAKLLKNHGYHTTMVGKWHLGAKPGMRPTDKGFDEFVGFHHNASLYLPIDDPSVVNSRQEFDPNDVFSWNNLQYSVRQDGQKRFKPDKYLTDYFTDQAVDIINKNKNRPFFLYLAYNAPHTPLQAKKADYEALADISDHTERVYGAMIRAVDRGVGRVLDTLKANGLENNTLVFFTSDNGGAHYLGLPYINRPFRGWKVTFFEGGIHVPFFVKWPAGLPSGKTYTKRVSQVDIFATAAAAAGVPLPKDRVIDGVDLAPFVAEDRADRPHERMFWRSGHYRVVIVGDWKLQVTERPQKMWLFNLAKDPTERANLAESEPAKLKELLTVLNEMNAQMKKPMWPNLVEMPVMIDHTLKERDPGPEAEYIYWAN